MATDHQIVIIGASFSGLAVSQNLLRDILPALSASGKNKYKVVQIAPSDDFYFKIAAPRVLVNPSALPVEKALFPIAPHFSKYGPEQYEFIKAAVTSIEPASKTLQLSTSNSVRYDTLVIASGTHFANDLWSNANGSDSLRSAIKEVHDRLPNAQTILVAGGGPAGVETAGELGEVFGKKKEVTLLSGTTNLLNSLNNKKVGLDAQSRLEKMGVKVVHDGVRVTSHTHENGKDVLKLSNGETQTVDLYIEATGDIPNSKFLPAEWLDEKNKVKTDPQTLRLNVPGVTGVYCFGTVGSYSNGSIADVLFAKKAILETLRLDLQEGQQTGTRTKNVYKKMTSDFMFVPIGPNQGVGIAFGWKLPSFAIKMAKSKDFMIGNAPKWAEGTA